MSQYQMATIYLLIFYFRKRKRVHEITKQEAKSPGKCQTFFLFHGKERGKREGEGDALVVLVLLSLSLSLRL